jgi:hypothetical protein
MASVGQTNTNSSRTLVSSQCAGHVHAVNEGKFVPRAYPSSQGDYDKIVYVDTGCGCWHTAPLSAIVIEDGKVGKVIQAWPEQ